MPVVDDERSVEGLLTFSSDYRHLSHKNSAYTASSDGRFIFFLQKFDCADNRDHCTFQLDIIDMLFAEITTYPIIGAFHHAGRLCGFYTLNEETVVILTYYEGDEDVPAEVVRQWLVCIDKDSKTACCELYRNYAIVFPGEFDRLPVSFIGEEFALVRTTYDWVLLPRNPLSSLQHNDITQWILQASARLPSQSNYRLDSTAGLACPFFITASAIGFIVRVTTRPWRYNVMHVVVMDLTNGSTYLQEVESAAPLSIDGTQIITNCCMEQTNDREVVLMAFCDDVAVLMVVLDTRLLQYTEIRGFGRELGSSTADEFLVALPDCIILVDETKREVDEKCVLTGHVLNVEKIYTQQYKLIRHPRKIPRLLRLAAVATWKSEDLMSSEIKDQMSTRIG